MHKHRFYISPKDIADNTAVIHQPEYHHVVDVLRCDEKDDIFLFDGKGNEYPAKIESIDRMNKSVRVSLGKVRKERIKRELVLVQSLIKSSNMGLVIQKATELGVTHLYPLVTANSLVKIESGLEEGKLDKWRRISEEASKQCGRNWLPEISGIWKLNEVLDSLSWIETKIVCSKTGGKSLKDVLYKKQKSVAVMIGPEGDFTDSELKFIRSKGWTPIHLGETLLRSETAAIAVLGAMCHKFGFWD